MMGMDEYINKNALYREIAQLEELSRDRYLKLPSDSPCRPRYMTELTKHTYFKHIIADFPAADVEPVKHGRWSVDGVYVVCSVCNRLTLSPIVKQLPTFKYCPNCGAKMDEKEA